jgi:uncharacterized protein (TIGR02996 family)
MIDFDALLRCVLAHPQEDGPRLVYADALEEVGECQRAEFIRVQIEIANLEKREDARGYRIGLRDRKWDSLFIGYADAMLSQREKP